MYLEMLKRFCRAESGAVTVDFVTISAVIVGFGMGVILLVAPGVKSEAASVTPTMQTSAGLAGRLLLGISD